MPSRVNTTGRTKSKSPGPDYARAWAEATSCHGIIDYHNTNLCCVKCFWALLLVAAFGMATWQIYGLMRNYLTKPYYMNKIILGRLVIGSCQF